MIVNQANTSYVRLLQRVTRGEAFVPKFHGALAVMNTIRVNLVRTTCQATSRTCLYVIYSPQDCAIKKNNYNKIIRKKKYLTTYSHYHLDT